MRVGDIGGVGLVGLLCKRIKSDRKRTKRKEPKEKIEKDYQKQENYFQNTLIRSYNTPIGLVHRLRNI